MKKFRAPEFITDENDRELIEYFYTELKSYFPEKNTKEPYLTDHGALHISNVIDNATVLLAHEPFKFNKKDYLYLAQSIIIHDLALGNFEDGLKEGHASRIQKVFYERIKKLDALYSRIKDYNTVMISRIAAAHGDKNAEKAYDEIIDDVDLSMTNEDDPHILFLSMLLRISDELDITQKRLEDYILEERLKSMEKESQKHWIKHESIVRWVIMKDKNSSIVLYLKNNIDDILRHDEYNLKFDEGEYLEFMCRAISKLKYELDIIDKKCRDMGPDVNWKLNNVVLKKFKINPVDKSGYINELNEMISKTNYRDKFAEENNPVLGKVDDNIRQKREEKERIGSEIIVSIAKEEDKNYIKIGEDKYRERLDKYIKKNKYMLRQGCFEHRKMKIFTWLDSFSLHQSNSFLRSTCDIMAKDIEQRNSDKEKIDIIIGLELRGAKIATVVGLKLEKPVYFFVNDDIKVENLDPKVKYNIIMITDCIITGQKAFECIAKLAEKRIHCQNKSVYCVFIRNPVPKDNKLVPKENTLDKFIKNNIPIYAINDTYSYTVCPFQDPKDCPLHICYEDKYYVKDYKN